MNPISKTTGREAKDGIVKASELKRLVRMEAEAKRLSEVAQSEGRYNDAAIEGLAAANYGHRIHAAMVARNGGAR
jgi:hypothetical protein